MRIGFRHGAVGVFKMQLVRVEILNELRQPRRSGAAWAEG